MFERQVEQFIRISIFLPLYTRRYGNSSIIYENICTVQECLKFN